MEPEKKDGLTLGQYVELVRSKNLIPPATFKGYPTRLRQIVSEIKGIKSTRNRFGPQGKGRQAWIAKVDSVPLGSISPDDVRAWKRREIDKVRRNVILRKQYTISICGPFWSVRLEPTSRDAAQKELAKVMALTPASRPKSALSEAWAGKSIAQHAPHWMTDPI